MLLIDHLFHVWVHDQQPTIRALSYVDNWDVLTRQPDHAVRQLDLVLQFASLVDLTIDRKKTFGWSTHASIRKAFRDEGIIMSSRQLVTWVLTLPLRKAIHEFHDHR